MNSYRWFLVAILVAVVGTTLALRESTRQRDALLDERIARESEIVRLEGLSTGLEANLANVMSEIAALTSEVQELEQTQAQERGELRDLRQSVAEVTASLSELALALDTPLDEISPVAASEPLRDLPPSPEAARLLTLDDIPAWRRSFIQPNTILVSGHDSKWGQFRVKVDGVNIPLTDSVAAEACALLHSELRATQRLAQEDAIASGDCPLFDSNDAASSYAQEREKRALLLGEDSPNFAIVPWGDQFAYVRGEQFDDAPEVQALRRQIRNLGSRLLAGRSGRYGVIWTPFE